MILTEGDTWRRARRAFAPAFTPAYLKGLLPTFHAKALVMGG